MPLAVPEAGAVTFSARNLAVSVFGSIAPPAPSPTTNPLLVFSLGELATSMASTAPVGVALQADENVSAALRERNMAESFDRVREELLLEDRARATTLGAYTVASAGFTVGYALWLARGGALVASLAAALPAWAMVDPLPVLGQVRKRRDDDRSQGADDAPGSDASREAERLFDEAAPAPTPAPPVPADTRPRRASNPRDAR
jgi:hypothetical protein